jgi:hypothetical protein
VGALRGEDRPPAVQALGGADADEVHRAGTIAKPLTELRDELLERHRVPVEGETSLTRDGFGGRLAHPGIALARIPGNPLRLDGTARVGGEQRKGDPVGRDVGGVEGETASDVFDGQLVLRFPVDEQHRDLATTAHRLFHHEVQQDRRILAPAEGHSDALKVVEDK